MGPLHRPDPIPRLGRRRILHRRHGVSSKAEQAGRAPSGDPPAFSSPACNPPARTTVDTNSAAAGTNFATSNDELPVLGPRGAAPPSGLGSIEVVRGEFLGRKRAPLVLGGELPRLRTPPPPRRPRQQWRLLQPFGGVERSFHLAAEYDVLMAAPVQRVIVDASSR